MPKGFVYILECSDGSYYTGSTVDLDQRVHQHQNGQGANYTKKRLPVKLVYLEEFKRIDDAFHKEKQIQGWNRAKKEALIQKQYDKLPELSLAYRDKVSSRASDTARASDTKTFYSHGKLLISGEYIVLDGALALALPTKFGQSLLIEQIEEPKLLWKSVDNEDTIWFEDEFIFKNDEILRSVLNDNLISARLAELLNAARKLNPSFLNTQRGYKITSTLEFPQNWGLGSSSTLINNLSNWANVDAYELLDLTFGGSGYDIACAQNDTAITYQLKNKSPLVKTLDFYPEFNDSLYFVHLNKKQDSREGIAHYKSNRNNLDATILEINALTKRMITCKELSEFEVLMEQHESITASLINLEPIKKRLFKDFHGAIKSLGAWGGDFVLVASHENPRDYFKSKGFETILPYNKMILK